ncbi:lymphocyte expansion molecule isoform X2 [Astyanax mexicanus]|uniref:Lymphocyte expansion molecule isoform X2 n=1 Tax=Astyanax mexicanus TaxID=7994 RepID=A0A8T2MPT2_ASTMX|nr:lymphocyte expansion molecule isoform X2 [Astyanax mexicanus]
MKMADKKFKGAPFGSQSHRFDVSGVHPANKRVGTYTQISYCKRRTSDLERNLGPGTYNPDSGDFSARAVRERSMGPDWKRAQETARLAQIPHLLYRDAWANKQFLKTKVGPGTYKIPSFTEELKKKPSSLRGICETREERFKDCQNTSVGPGIYKITSFIEDLEKKPGSPKGICETREQRFKDFQSCTPGPGAYGKGGIPSASLEEKERRNRGNSIDSSARLKRFPENIVKRTNLGPGEYTKEVLKFGEELQRPEKKKHGVFSSLEQYPSVPTERIYLSTLPQCPRLMTFPGPGWYDVSPVTPSRQSRSETPAPFLSSASRFSKSMETLLNKNHNMVGPGRYEIADKNWNSTGHSSAFISDTQRYPNCPARDKYNQERLRPQNVSLEGRSSLVPTEGPI